MPFVSRAQANVCYSKNDKKWDCDKWAKETKWCQLPYKVSGTVHLESSNCTGKDCDHFIRTGDRGGRYFACPPNNRKVYLSNNYSQSSPSPKKSSPSPKKSSPKKSSPKKSSPKKSSPKKSSPKKSSPKKSSPKKLTRTRLVNKCKKHKGKHINLTRCNAKSVVIEEGLKNIGVY